MSGRNCIYFLTRTLKGVWHEIFGGNWLMKKTWSWKSQVKFCQRPSNTILNTRCLCISGQHADWVLPHWLAILSWFPETTPPHTYQQLLPAISMQGTLIPWLRQVSWLTYLILVGWFSVAQVAPLRECVSMVVVSTAIQSRSIHLGASHHCSSVVLPPPPPLPLHCMDKRLPATLGKESNREVWGHGCGFLIR